ncbi:vitamin K epoxide reductase family protein [Tunturibacter empetritectus]|uniref:vitamin K epoxide reductase family protein n=1 Tax=Tunturiibacter empetritectus TaxID=3069691 RepID=UPI001607F15A|nr:vitamin K epoxide reductase family protein [Edaphobacter lichenicola]
MSEQIAPFNTALVVATSAAVLTLFPVAAHQLNLLSHLPDPPSAVFASDDITESSAAHPFGIPDSLLGLGSYGATLALILLSQRRPMARKVLAMKLIADGSVAGFNVVRQLVSFGKICSWCTGTALCTAAMLFAGRKLIAEETAVDSPLWLTLTPYQK